MFNEKKYLAAKDTAETNPSEENFLLNDGLYYYDLKTISKGFLLVGGPGTGKTYFVKALAGETQCPIITNSYEKKPETVYNPEQMDLYQNTVVLRKMFKTAKFRSPSIIFMDEFDSIGSTRSSIMGPKASDPLGPALLYNRDHDTKYHCFTHWQRLSTRKKLPNLMRADFNYWSVKNPKIANSHLTPYTRSRRFKDSLVYATQRVNYYLDFTKAKDKNLDSVTTLLCELDGIGEKDDVVVIGATNRPSVIDPALKRAGRLGNIIYFSLPRKQKRLQLLIYYADKLYDKKADWNFFAGHGQSGGLSSAHLKVAINNATLSLIKKSLKVAKANWFAKRQVEKHTNLSLEYGIHSVKYENNYVKQLTLKIGKQIFAECYSRDTLKLIQPHNYFYVSTGVETFNSANARYIVDRIPGIRITKPRFPTFNYLQGADVSAPTKPKQHNYKSKTFYNQQTQNCRLLYLLNPKKQLFLNNITQTSQINAFGLNRFKYIIEQQQSQTQTNAIEQQQSQTQTNDVAQEENQTIQIFNNYQHYSTHQFKRHSFGLNLTIDNSYFISNPLRYSLRPLLAKLKGHYIRSSFHWANSNKKHVMDYKAIETIEAIDIGRYKKVSLFEQVYEKLDNLQTDRFRDNLTLKRAIYYNAAKALVLSLLDYRLFESSTLTFWNNIKHLKQSRYSQETYVQTVAGQLFSKRHFHNHLLFLIAGKVGEHMLLKGSHSENFSDIGLEDNQQFGWLGNIMIEKGLYYSPNSLINRRSMIQSLPSPLNTPAASPLIKILGKRERLFSHKNDYTPVYKWWRPKLCFDTSFVFFTNGDWKLFFEEEISEFLVEERSHGLEALPQEYEPFNLNYGENINYYELYKEIYSSGKLVIFRKRQSELSYTDLELEDVSSDETIYQENEVKSSPAKNYLDEESSYEEDLDEKSSYEEDLGEDDLEEDYLDENELGEDDLEWEDDSDEDDLGEPSYEEGLDEEDLDEEESYKEGLDEEESYEEESYEEEPYEEEPYEEESYEADLSEEESYEKGLDEEESYEEDLSEEESYEEESYDEEPYEEESYEEELYEEEPYEKESYDNDFYEDLGDIDEDDFYEENLDEDDLDEDDLNEEYFSEDYLDEDDLDEDYLDEDDLDEDYLDEDDLEWEDDSDEEHFYEDLDEEDFYEDLGEEEFWEDDLGEEDFYEDLGEEEFWEDDLGEEESYEENLGEEDLGEEDFYENLGEEHLGEDDLDESSNEEGSHEEGSNEEGSHEEGSNEDDSYNYLLNNDPSPMSKEIFQTLNTADTQWNAMSTIETEPLLNQLVLETYNYAYHLLDTNRPLFGCFVKHFYSHNRLTGIEAKRIAMRFLSKPEYTQLVETYDPYRPIIRGSLTSWSLFYLHDYGFLFTNTKTLINCGFKGINSFPLLFIFCFGPLFIEKNPGHTFDLVYINYFGGLFMVHFHNISFWPLLLVYYYGVLFQSPQVQDNRFALLYIDYLNKLNLFRNFFNSNGLYVYNVLYTDNILYTVLSTYNILYTYYSNKRDLYLLNLYLFIYYGFRLFLF